MSNCLRFIIAASQAFVELGIPAWFAIKCLVRHIDYHFNTQICWIYVHDDKAS